MSRKETTTLPEAPYRPLKEPAAVRRMFADIAPRYDFLNHLLSANVDRLWRRTAVRLAELRPSDAVLDVCTGTGDLAFAAARHVSEADGGRVVGTDFCAEMVQLARRKDRDGRVRFVVADTLRLPFPAESFDAVMVAFGIRNVGGLEQGLTEMRRVLRPGGRAVLLEFTTPRSRVVRGIFGLYFNHLLPRIGRWLSPAPRPEVDDAYRYLPDSVSSFPRPAGLRESMERCGFEGVRYELLTFGVAAVHVGTAGGAA